MRMPSDYKFLDEPLTEDDLLWIACGNDEELFDAHIEADRQKFRLLEIKDPAYAQHISEEIRSLEAFIAERSLNPQNSLERFRSIEDRRPNSTYAGQVVVRDIAPEHSRSV